MTPPTPILKIPLHADQDLVLVRQRTRQIAGLLGLDAGTRSRAATAVSEIARVILEGGERGEIEFAVCPGAAADDLGIRAHGDGPDVTSFDESLRDVRELADAAEIHRASSGAPRVEMRWRLGHTVTRQALDELRDRLHQEPPGSAFTEVQQQHQELLHAQKALAHARRELASADRSKDRFMAMLGHELRNLLNALHSGLEVLKRDPPPALQARMQNLAIGQTEHLRRLIDDLLDASQIQRGQLEVRALALDLTREVEALLESWHGEVSRAGLRLRIERPAEILWARADPTRLAQIVGNLLSNACKFTDPGGEIVVRIEESGDRVRLTVADTGCGMEPDALEKVFEPFAQTSEAKKRMTGGLGLGLAIVRGLVESHGGAMRAESDGPGHGTRFLVELPRVEEPQEETMLIPVAEPEGLKILLVDDHRASVEGLAELLRLEGHEVEVALDGPQALEIHARMTPDIMLCDLGLPGMDGYEVARLLRSSEDGEALRLLALSGFADPEAKNRAIEAGFDAHLSKPVNVVELIQRLHAEEG
ncbi:MAG: ATP-binding protein [Acidobacteriota bacterium]